MGEDNAGPLQLTVCLSSCSLANRLSLGPASQERGVRGVVQENSFSVAVKRGQQCWQKRRLSAPAEPEEVMGRGVFSGMGAGRVGFSDHRSEMDCFLFSSSFHLPL